MCNQFLFVFKIELQCLGVTLAYSTNKSGFKKVIKIYCTCMVVEDTHSPLVPLVFQKTQMMKLDTKQNYGHGSIKKNFP